MAHFYQRSLSAGKWAADQSVLTIKIGQTAELILWGSGPAGQERLVPVIRATMTCKFVEDGITPVGPNERLLKVTPREAGEAWVNARVGTATGSDYAAPVKVVCIPNKGVSIGPEHVILCNADDIQEAYNKASGTSATAYAVGNMPAFTRFLTNFRNAGRRIGKLELNTHGSPGAIYFGPDWLDEDMIRHFKGQGFDSAFSPGAHIFFHGCNVAEGYQGNGFLYEFAVTFLCGGGGQVGASTSLGITHRLNQIGMGSGKVYHLWGKTKRVIIAPGGHVLQRINFDDDEPAPIDTSLSTPP